MTIINFALLNVITQVTASLAQLLATLWGGKWTVSP